MTLNIEMAQIKNAVDKYVNGKFEGDAVEVKVSTASKLRTLVGGEIMGFCSAKADTRDYLHHIIIFSDGDIFDFQTTATNGYLDTRLYRLVPAITDFI